LLSYYFKLISLLIFNVYVPKMRILFYSYLMTHANISLGLSSAHLLSLVYLAYWTLFRSTHVWVTVYDLFVKYKTCSCLNILPRASKISCVVNFTYKYTILKIWYHFFNKQQSIIILNILHTASKCYGLQFSA